MSNARDDHRCPTSLVATSVPALAGSSPKLEQRVDDRVEVLLRRVPGLEQVVVEVDDVDGLDRGVGVRVRSEQCPPSLWIDVHGLLQELQATHLGHPVVGQEHGHRLVAEPELTQGVEGGSPGLGPDDPVLARRSAGEDRGPRPGTR